MEAMRYKQIPGEGQSPSALGMRVLYLGVFIGGIYTMFLVVVVVGWTLNGYKMISDLFSRSEEITWFITISHLAVMCSMILHVWMAFLVDSWPLFAIVCAQVVGAVLCLACDVQVASEGVCHVVSCSLAGVFTYLYFGVLFYLEGGHWAFAPRVGMGVLVVLSVLGAAFWAAGDFAPFGGLEFASVIVVFVMDYISVGGALDRLRGGSGGLSNLSIRA